MEQAKGFMIGRLGDCAIPSPLNNVLFTGDDEHILFNRDYYGV